MNNTEEKIVEEWRITFRVIRDPDTMLYLIPTQSTILEGTQKECLDELYSWVNGQSHLDIVEIERVDNG